MITVALLVKRGKCSYETKARIASTLTHPRGSVQFVIVYNDVDTSNIYGGGPHYRGSNNEEDENDGDLITMMPDHTDANNNYHDLYKDLGLVFVSYKSGMELHDVIIRHSQQQQQHAADDDVKGGGGVGGGGPQILIDGEIDSTRSILSPEDEETVMGLAVTLFFVGCLCSSSLFLNAARNNAMGGGGGGSGNDSNSCNGRNNTGGSERRIG